MCSRFLLNVLRSTILYYEYSPLAAHEIVFNMFYMKNTTFSDTIYVIIMTKYTPECTKFQHLKYFLG